MPGHGIAGSLVSMAGRVPFLPRSRPALTGRIEGPLGLLKQAVRRVVVCLGLLRRRQGTGAGPLGHGEPAPALSPPR